MVNIIHYMYFKHKTFIQQMQTNVYNCRFYKCKNVSFFSRKTPLEFYLLLCNIIHVYNIIVIPDINRLLKTLV